MREGERKRENEREAEIEKFKSLESRQERQ